MSVLSLAATKLGGMVGGQVWPSPSRVSCASWITWITRIAGAPGECKEGTEQDGLLTVRVEDFYVGRTDGNNGSDNGEQAGGLAAYG